MASTYEYLAPDLADIRINGESEICEELKRRYEKDLIYTAIGPNILLYLNPFKPLAIFDKSFINMYSSSLGEQLKSPHIYGFVANIYKKMIHTSQDQIIFTM